jgi:serine/threonine protein phosphatase PrpC
MVFDCATRTHVGHRRKLNEDALLDCGEHGLWAVADGMGGHEAGEVASAMVVETLGNFADAGTIEDRIEKVIAALEAVNLSLHEMGRASSSQRTIGTTVVGLVADDKQYRCFWAGDSRAYRLRSGSIVQLTRDHSLVQDLVDAGMIEPAEAEMHPNSNVVTRAVGASERLQVDTVGGPLSSGDIFLLASDGLTRLVRIDEIALQLTSQGLDAAADRLIELALDRGAPDNVSLIIVRYRP